MNSKRFYDFKIDYSLTINKEFPILFILNYRFPDSRINSQTNQILIDNLVYDIQPKDILGKRRIKGAVRFTLIEADNQQPDWVKEVTTHA